MYNLLGEKSTTATTATANCAALLLVYTRVFRLVTHRLFRGDQSWLSLIHIGDGGGVIRGGGGGGGSDTSTFGSTAASWIIISIGAGGGGDGVLMRY